MNKPDNIMQFPTDNEFFKALFDGAGDGILVADGETKEIFMANDAICEMLGYSKEEFCALSVKDIHPQESLPEVLAAFENQKNKNSTFAENLPVKRKDGSVFFADINASPVNIGSKMRLVGIFRDISTQKKLEQWYEHAQQVAKLGQWNFDITSNTLSWSSGVFDLFEIDPSQFSASYEAFLEAIHPDDRDLVSTAYEKSLITKEPYEITHRLLMPDGRIKYVKESCHTEFSTDGQPLHSIGFIQDISKVQLTEKQLVESEERYRMFFENVNDAIFIHQGDTIIDCNNKAVELYRAKSKEEILRRKVADLSVARQDTGENSGNLANHKIEVAEKESSEPFEWKARRLDGTIFDVEVSLSRFDLHNRSYVMAVVRDISRKKAYERRIKQSEEKFKNLVENSSDIIWEVDNTGHYTYLSPQTEGILGYTPEELLGKTPFELMPQDVCERVVDIFKQHVQDKLPIHNIENINICKDGRLVTLETSGQPILDDKGKNLLGFRGIDRDISERKQTEKQLREARHDAEAATRAKSDFLANMSHEIRTPMNAILGMTRLALDSDNIVESKKYMGIVLESGEALLHLINGILDFSKIESGKLTLENKVFDLEQVVKGIAKMFTQIAQEKNISFSCELSAKIVHDLMGDEFKLRQILINLVGNAIKFTEKGDVALSVQLLEEKNNGRIVLQFEVSDTGIGISQQKQKQIFDFFSQADNSITRTFGGSGLGLTISSKLAQLMNGRVWVESKEGQGSTFYFTCCFEKADAPQLTSHPQNSEEHETTGDVSPINILLVDDNDLNLKLAQIILEKKGHKITTAQNGLVALQMLARKTFDVVLMDIQMPKLDGLTTTSLIRQCENGEIEDHPEHSDILLPLMQKIKGGKIPIIAMTAGAREEDREKCLAAGMNNYISKPFKPEEIFTTLKKVIRCP